MCAPKLQGPLSRADQTPMGGGSDFRHGCSFCGWSRESATPVMLSPSCDRCGCRLDARVARDPARLVPDRHDFVIPPWGVTLVRRLAMLVGALALYAAAALGYDTAGPAGAMVAAGAGGFVMLPFVPERLEG